MQSGHVKSYFSDFVAARHRLRNVTRPQVARSDPAERGATSSRGARELAGGRSDFDPRLVEHVELNQHLFSAARMGRCALP